MKKPKVWKRKKPWISRYYRKLKKNRTEKANTQLAKLARKERAAEQSTASIDFDLGDDFEEI